MVCAVFRVARSTVYATSAARPAVPLGKRGPKTATSDAELVGAIRAVLAATPFHGEGYRKVRARLAHRGLAVGGKRMLRLMRQHQLLAPRRLGPHLEQRPRLCGRGVANVGNRPGRREWRPDSGARSGRHDRSGVWFAAGNR